jgi:hypothetical protein
VLIQPKAHGATLGIDPATINLLPDTFGKISGVSFAVTGTTANNYDGLASLHSRTPLVLAVAATGPGPGSSRFVIVDNSSPWLGYSCRNQLARRP